MATFYNASLRNLKYRLRSVKDSIPLYIEDAVRETSQVIVKAISQDQLYRRGINGKGIKIMDYEPYKPMTIAIKQKKGQPTTRVTLKDTGSFYDNMYVAFVPGETGGFYVTSRDEKTDDLVAKYGPEIFRLTDDNFTRIVRVHIKKKLQRIVKQAMKQNV